MNWKIKYEYEQSESMSDDIDVIEGFVEISWSNLDVAKENLKRIDEHKEVYRKLNDYSFVKRNRQDILKEYANKDWFVKEDKLAIYKDENHYFVIDPENKNRVIKEGYNVKTIIDETVASNCIRLYTDDGKTFQFWCPWVGYFEHFISAEIVPDNEGMKI